MAFQKEGSPLTGAHRKEAKGIALPCALLPKPEAREPKDSAQGLCLLGPRAGCRKWEQGWGGRSGMCSTLSHPALGSCCPRALPVVPEFGGACGLGGAQQRFSQIDGDGTSMNAHLGRKWVPPVCGRGTSRFIYKPGEAQGREEAMALGR